MADDKDLDSFESKDGFVLPEDTQEPSGFGSHAARPVEDADGVDDGYAPELGDERVDDLLDVHTMGEDQPGENLASDRLSEDMNAYEIAPDETEAEELTDAGLATDDEMVTDDAQLAEAEAVAIAATSTRPVKRKQKRAMAEAGLAEVPATELDTTPSSLRPQKKQALPEKKDHATPKRRSANHEEHKRVGPAQFVRESIEELRKVVWPTGAQLWQYFVVVLVFVLFIIAFVSLLDFGFGWLLLKLFG